MAGFNQNAQLRDRATGYGIFTAAVADGWEVINTSLGARNTSSKPYAPMVELHCPANGAVMRLAAGDAGTRNSTGMNIMTAMYGMQTVGIDSTNIADMPDPATLSAQYALQQLEGVQGVGALHFDSQIDLGDPAEEFQQVGEVMRRQLGDGSGLMPMGSPFVARTLHTYRFTLDGAPWCMAVFLRLYASKLGGFDTGALGGMLGGLASSLGDAVGGLTGSLGQAFGAAGEQVSQAGSGGLKGLIDFGMQGGLIGKAMRDNRAAQAQQAPQQAQARPQHQPISQQAQQQAAQPQEAAPLGCTHAFAAYSRSGTIIWSVETLAALICPEQDFSQLLSAEFIPMALSARLHPDILGLTAQFVSREAAAIQGATNVALANKQAQFQAQQAAHRQQQAAYDSYNQAWQARSDAHHQAFRAATNAQFSTPTTGNPSPDYSEAIRGVNTYTTSDGREVEVSTHADRAWENQAGDVIGTSGGFEPGADWTELPRT